MPEETLEDYIDGLSSLGSADPAADFLLIKDTSAGSLKKIAPDDLGIGGGGAWGSITGTLSAQTDLQTALNAKKTDSMATNKLLGRGSASTGAIEEITLGTNLSLSGTTLNATGGGSSANIYAANVTQTGTGDPTATVGQNDLGGTVVWTRTGVGSYEGTLVGAFAGTVIITTGYDYFGSAFAVRVTKGSNNVIQMYTYDYDTTPADLDGGTASLYVLVYP